MRMMTDLRSIAAVGQRCQTDRRNFWWDRIFTATAPRVATAESSASEPASAQGAVLTNGFDCVARTRRCEAATKTHRGKQCRQHRRDDAAINPQGEGQNVLCRIQAVDGSAPATVSRYNRAFFNVVK